MRMKLLVGIILCILAIVGIATSIYAWKMTAEARDDQDSIDDKLEELKTSGLPDEEKTIAEATLKADKKEARDNAETNQRTAGMASTISIILAVLGMLLIVLDVLKVKDSGDEEETATEEKEEPPSGEEE